MNAIKCLTSEFNNSIITNGKIIMKKTEYCYWCGKPATSREHVPPKCLFPEKKDIYSIYESNFRKNLITVPSCDEHNLEKSNDDEYLMTVLAGAVGNNGIAYIHNMTKVGRARKRNEKLVNVISNGTVKINGRNFPVELIKLDNYKLSYSFEAIGRALYFKEYNKIFDGKIKVISNIFNDYDKRETDSPMIKAAKMIGDERIHWSTKCSGENPKIFLYQFSPIDGFGVRTLYLRFYERLEVYIVFMEDITQNMNEQEKVQFQKRLSTLKALSKAIFK